MLRRVLGWLLAPAALASQLCTEPERALPPNVTVLTSIPSVPFKDPAIEPHPHLLEALLAIGENTRNPLITEVRVIIDKYPAPPDYPSHDLDQNATGALRTTIMKTQAEYMHRLDVRASEEDILKVRAHVYNEQPTYAQLLRYASYALPQQMVLLSNADVVFRRLNILDAAAFPSGRLLALALAVRKPMGNFAATCEDTRVVIDRCDNHGWSFDAFLFRSPIVAGARWDLLEEVRPQPVYMNDNGSELRCAAFLINSGYEIYQPCLFNMTEHWHCKAKMHHLKGDADVNAWDGDKRELYRGWGTIKPVTDFPGLRCGAEASELHESLLPDDWLDLVN